MTAEQKFEMVRSILQAHTYNAFGEPKDALQEAIDNWDMTGEKPTEAEWGDVFKAMLEADTFEDFEEDVSQLLIKKAENF